MKRILNPKYINCLNFIAGEFGVRATDNKICLCNNLHCVDCLFDITRECENIYDWLAYGTNLEKNIEQMVKEGSYDLAYTDLEETVYCRNMIEYNRCDSCIFHSPDGNCAQRKIDWLLEEI